MQHICFLADKTELAQTSLKNLRKTYGCSGAENADVFVVLGGDGFMLQTLHRYIGKGIPFYGMNCGSVGFLMNKYQEKDLPERLNNAGLITLRPLVMEAYADAAVKYGIQRPTAYRLVAQTMLGSAKLQQVTGEHPGVLKDAVCSPNGTTIRGVDTLEKKGLRGACISSIDTIMDFKSGK